MFLIKFFNRIYTCIFVKIWLGLVKLYCGCERTMILHGQVQRGTDANALV